MTKTFIKTFLHFLITIFLLGLTVGFAYGMTQDVYCDLINDTMTVSECNELWFLTTNTTNTVITNTVYVNNFTENTIIQNNSIENAFVFDIDDYEDELEDYFEDFIDDYETSGLNFEEQLALRELDYKHEETLRNYNRSVGVVSVPLECDFLCEMEEAFKSQMEMQRVKDLWCGINPSLEGCSVSSVVVSNTNSSGDNDMFIKLQSELANIKGQINNPVLVDKSLIEEYGFFILLFGLGGMFYFGQKELVKVQSTIRSKSDAESEDTNKGFSIGLK